MALIDVDIARRDIRRAAEEVHAFYLRYGYPTYKGQEEGLEMALRVLRYQPTIEAEPVRHGRWIKKENYGGGTYTACSECGAMMNLPWFWYCGKCGAIMDAADDQRGGAENGKM